jgi:hypothetical protein
MSTSTRMTRTAWTPPPTHVPSLCLSTGSSQCPPGMQLPPALTSLTGTRPHQALDTGEELGSYHIYCSSDGRSVGIAACHGVKEGDLSAPRPACSRLGCRLMPGCSHLVFARVLLRVTHTGSVTPMVMQSSRPSWLATSGSPAPGQHVGRRPGSWPCTRPGST